MHTLMTVIDSALLALAISIVITGLGFVIVRRIHNPHAVTDEDIDTFVKAATTPQESRELVANPCEPANFLVLARVVNLKGLNPSNTPINIQDHTIGVVGMAPIFGTYEDAQKWAKSGLNRGPEPAILQVNVLG